MYLRRGWLTFEKLKLIKHPEVVDKKVAANISPINPTQSQKLYSGCEQNKQCSSLVECLKILWLSTCDVWWLGSKTEMPNSPSGLHYSMGFWLVLRTASSDREFCCLGLVSLLVESHCLDIVQHIPNEQMRWSDHCMPVKSWRLGLFSECVHVTVHGMCLFFLCMCIVEFSLSNQFFHCKTSHDFKIVREKPRSPHLPGFIGNTIIYPGRKIWCS